MDYRTTPRVPLKSGGHSWGQAKYLRFRLWWGGGWSKLGFEDWYCPKTRGGRTFCNIAEERLEVDAGSWGYRPTYDQVVVMVISATDDGIPLELSETPVPKEQTWVLTVFCLFSFTSRAEYLWGQWVSQLTRMAGEGTSLDRVPDSLGVGQLSYYGPKLGTCLTRMLKNNGQLLYFNKGSSIVKRF